MSLSDVAIKRPVFTSMMSLCLLVLGIMGFKRLGTDLFPDVSFPVVTVTTVYRGAGPGEIENQVVKPIEDSVAGISGIDKIHSFSRENAGVVFVQFKLSENLDRAVQEVRDKVASVTNKLPKDSDAPLISRVDIGAAPVLTYAASSSLDSQKTRKLIEDKLQPALQQLEGVAEVRVTGGDVREIQVDIDLDKARAAGTSPFEIAQKIGFENLNLPAGHLSLGPTELTVRTLGEFRNVEEIRNLPIAIGKTGSQVRLSEVAAVTDGVVERRTVARLNGQDAIILEVVKQPGSNTVQVADQVKKTLHDTLPALANGFKTTLLIDQSDLIRANAEEVYIALFFGGAMAVLIILMFLLDPRGTFISSLALPTSVIGTFFVMFLLGYTLNQMTLLALSLAIGLLIDDAVVVREAITHRLDQGEEPAAAASRGTKDVGLAVLATTLSLVAVFVPVAFMPGIVGQFFKQFGITISAAVLISLFISFTLDPMLSARLAKARKPGEVRKEAAIARVFREAFEATERWYERVLAMVLRHKWISLGAAVAVTVLSFAATSGLRSEFLSVEDRSQFIVDLQLPDSASLDLSGQRAAEAEKLLRAMPEVKDVYAIVGNNGEANKVRMRALTVPKKERKRGILALKDAARSALGKLPAVRVTITDPPTIEGLGDYYPIMVRLTGPDLKVLNEQGKWVAETLRTLPGTVDIKIDSNPPKPELTIAVDRTRSADLGLPAAQIATQLRLAIDGEVPAKLREGKDETDIRVRLAARDRGNPDRIRTMDLFSPRGVRQVADVAQVSLQDGPSVIEHENRERQIAVYSQLGTGAALGEIADKLKKAVAQHQMPPGYAVIYDGQMKTLNEQNDAFGAAFGLAFVFIFMVLASQFESLKHPFTIMVSLPLALIGARLALLLAGKNLSLGAMIGVILLMGLVTKNAILLVDGALQNIRDGLSVDEALLKAGPRRLRPILMTSAAMAIGMVPTAIGTGTGSEFRSPMAIAVIGGVITSTALTLLVVPVIFAGIEKLSLRGLVARLRRRPVAAPVTGAALAVLLLAGGARAQVPAGPPRGAPPAQAQQPLYKFAEGRERRPVSLREALQLAARQGPDVAAARAQAAIAQVSVERAWTAWKPDLVATGTFDHTSAPQEFDPAKLGLPASIPPLTIVAANSRYGTLQLSQPLFTPQGLFLPGIARNGADAASKGADEAREQVLLNVARTYLSLQGIEGLLAAAQDAEKVALHREADARAQISAGTAVEINLLRAQSDTAGARSQIANLMGQRESLLPLLEALVGEPVMPAGQGQDANLGQPASDASQPWERTFSVQSAVAQVKAAQGSVTYDSFLWLPTVAGVAKGNYNSNSGFAGTNTSYDLILSVSVPLYDRGTRYAQKHEDDARLQQALASLASTRARARATWQGARANLVAAQAVLEQAESQARVAKRAQEQIDVSFRAGVATSLDVTDADNRLFQAQSLAAQARSALDIRRAEVAAAEGRLFADLGR